VTKADAEFRWFVRTYTDRSNKDDDIKDPEELLIIGLAGSENARWHNLSSQFKFILQTLYVDAEKEADKAKEPPVAGRVPRPGRSCWRSTTARGARLVRQGADDHPRAAEALVGKGRAALQKIEIKQADEFADQALKINPRLPTPCSSRPTCS